jgi:hypothetical protein
VTTSSSENSLFELALFVLTSARTIIDEPKRYGPRRLLDTLEKLVNLPLSDHRITDDPFFEKIRNQMAAHPELRSSSVVFSERFKTFLDNMIVEFIEEIKKRSKA